MERITKYRFPTGTRLGKWTVLDGDPIWKPKGYVHFLCKCDCGTEREVAAQNLQREISTNCGCERRPVNFTGAGSLSGAYFARLKRGAKSRGLLFDITVEQAVGIFTGKCALSDRTITLNRHIRKYGQTASLDRIDSSRGYTIDNIQWIHKDLNVMKRDFNNDYFVQMCKAVANNNNS
jgi:hypothetical protein